MAFKRFSDCIHQILCWKWFRKICRTASLNCCLADHVAIVGRDEYYWNGDSGKGKPTSQFDSRHTAQVNVQHKTSGIASVRIVKKFFSARESLNIKPGHLQQT